MRAIWLATLYLARARGRVACPVQFAAAPRDVAAEPIIRLAVILISRRTGVDVRDAIRSTWCETAHALASPAASVVVRFFVGAAPPGARFVGGEFFPGEGRFVGDEGLAGVPGAEPRPPALIGDGRSGVPLELRRAGDVRDGDGRDGDEREGPPRSVHVGGGSAKGKEPCRRRSRTSGVTSGVGPPGARGGAGAVVAAAPKLSPLVPLSVGDGVRVRTAS